jgi:hypothetical protein
LAIVVTDDEAGVSSHRMCMVRRSCDCLVMTKRRAPVSVPFCLRRDGLGCFRQRPTSADNEA